MFFFANRLSNAGTTAHNGIERCTKMARTRFRGRDSKKAHKKNVLCQKNHEYKFLKRAKNLMFFVMFLPQ